MQPPGSFSYFKYCQRSVVLLKQQWLPSRLVWAITKWQRKGAAVGIMKQDEKGLSECLDSLTTWGLMPVACAPCEPVATMARKPPSDRQSNDSGWDLGPLARPCIQASCTGWQYSTDLRLWSVWAGIELWRAQANYKQSLHVTLAGFFFFMPCPLLTRWHKDHRCSVQSTCCYGT